MTKTSTSKIRIWDLPLRLFHWALATCTIGAYICIKFAGVDEGWIADSGIEWMDWHFYFGYSVLCLVLFRILWGFFGTYYARFSQFIKGPSTIFKYIKGDYQNFGHNPVGSLSVIIMLFFFGLQAASGLFVSDEILHEGPLFSISGKVSNVLTSLHYSNEIILIILVCMHIAAIFFYLLIKRKNLIRPMITGYDKLNKDCSRAVAFVENDFKLMLRAFVIFAVCCGFVYWLANYAAAFFNA